MDAVVAAVTSVFGISFTLGEATITLGELAIAGLVVAWAFRQSKKLMRG